MKSPDVDLDQVKKLLELVDSHGLDELTVEEGDLAITVRGGSAQPAVVAAALPANIQPSPVEQLPEAAFAPAEPTPVEEEVDESVVDIVAPLVGIFYRAPAPDAPAFVDVGDTIEVGTEVGLIEAMKVFSPIPSEVAGVVVAIPGENGKLVQQGDVLVRVRLSEEA